MSMDRDKLGGFLFLRRRQRKTARIAAATAAAAAPTPMPIFAVVLREDDEFDCSAATAGVEVAAATAGEVVLEDVEIVEDEDTDVVATGAAIAGADVCVEVGDWKWSATFHCKVALSFQCWLSRSCP